MSDVGVVLLLAILVGAIGWFLIVWSPARYRSPHPPPVAASHAPCNKKFAIVMGYYNRKVQTLQMLESLKQYAGTYDVEVIIGDDMSDGDNLLDAHISEYAYKIRLIKIHATVKTWFNCAISYNVAFHAMPDDTDIVIIQNPEVYHAGNILQHASQELGTEGKYLTYPVYASADSNFNEIAVAAGRSSGSEPVNWLELFDRKEGSWLNHTVHAKGRNLHWLSALTASDMRRIGGFDARYANGYNYEDDDFRDRISRVCAINTVDSDNAMGLHLWHPKSYMEDGPQSVLHEKMRANAALYEELQTKNDLGDYYRDPKVDVRVEVLKNFQ
jgi:hypothetical protein